jgi:aminoglycoside phosphotransferase (APT) family kinase protein
MDPLPGIDVATLEPWLGAHIDGAVAPFSFELFAAGGSNLTYRVTDADGVARVLRRPPVGRALETAHDMEREVRIIEALHAAGVVPVPACLGYCDDPAVTGAPFSVLEFVDGIVLRTTADTAGFTAEQADAATDALVATQVAMHTLDLDAVGLGDLGRHDGYVGRQLRRWRRQIDHVGLRPLPLLDELHDRLVATIPPERARPALAHGDYRFDNVILTADLGVAAVLDWELCTTGDPIADFAWSIRYWADPGDPLGWLPDAPTLAPVFPRRSEVVERYGAATGFDLSDLGWYEVFSWWKQACIVEGVHARRRRGATGGMRGGDVASIAARVDTMLEIAHDLAADRL